MNQDAQFLRQKKCVPCKGTEDPMPEAEVKHYLTVVEGWSTSDYKKIDKDFAFKNFKEAMEFVNKVASIAEEENHHPDIFLHNWRKVKIALTTHAIKGLSLNDFILASKTDVLQTQT